MSWSTLQQLIRIALYSIAAYFLGEGTADSSVVQEAISGAVMIAAFGWWVFHEKSKGEGGS